MTKLLLKRNPTYLANGKDTILLADGLITIRVTKIVGQEVQLLIDLPRDIPVCRGEVHATPYTQKFGE